MSVRLPKFSADQLILLLIVGLSAAALALWRYYRLY